MISIRDHGAFRLVQPDSETGAACWVVLSPHPPAVRLDDSLYDGQSQPALAHKMAEVEPRAIRQAHVQQDQVRVIAAGLLQAITATAFSGYPKAVALQTVLQAAGNGRVILNEQDLCMGIHNEHLPSRKDRKTNLSL